MHNNSEFVEKHNNRIKKQLEKLADIPKNIIWQQVNHPHSKSLKITIDKDHLNSLAVAALTKSQSIQFEILIGEQYPFIIPQVCCLTELTLLPKINDRRNLIENILGCPWGPAVLIKQIALGIPPLLKSIYQNRNSLSYLHSLGSYVQGGVYYKEDLQRSCMNLFDCKQSTKNILYMEHNIPAVIGLSDSFVVLFESKQQKLLLLKWERLRGTLSLTEKGDHLELGFYDESKRSFIFQPVIRAKQFSLIFKHRKDAAMAKQQPIGNITGFSATELRQKIKDLQLEIKENPSKQKFQDLKNYYSDMIQISSLTESDQTSIFKDKLVSLFNNNLFLEKS